MVKSELVLGRISDTFLLICTQLNTSVLWLWGEASSSFVVCPVYRERRPGRYSPAYLVRSNLTFNWILLFHIFTDFMMVPERAYDASNESTCTNGENSFTDVREHNGVKQKIPLKVSIFHPTCVSSIWCRQMKKKKVLHWIGVSLWKGSHYINNNNKNQTVIP